ncbi:type IV secretion system protein VirB3 [Caulobacter sp. KR2-114]|uniref:type IV secretion system protein VirB3 n=1 Tax=Caulobacter sp. KR2-114 TaxID=3400912 RepID=UPI003BFB7458
MSHLDRDTLFVGLTRPQMLAGVTYSFVIINAVVTTELFLMLKTPWVLAGALALHGVGWLACLREPRIFDIWLIKMSRCGRVRTWSIWRCNSYRA